MATTVGQHSVAAFTSPVNGTTPIDANTVRGNDNTVRVAYVDHDADPGIHVQSSTLASRPVAGTAGRKWITEDSGVYTLWFDDGTNWHPVSSENVALSVLATETLAKGDVVKVTGWNNGQDLPEVAKVASASDTAFAVMTAAVASGAMGYATNTGIVQDLNTGSFSVGNILYPNTSGGFTATKPTSGNYQPVAFVLRSNSSNGVIFVEFSAPRIVERSDNTASTIVLRDASGNFSAGTITAGAVTSTGLVTFASLKGTGATTVTNILDEDNMASDSATALATQQSIKAYVDTKVATVDTLAEVLANGNTTGANDIIVSTGQKIRTPAIAAGDGTASATIANSTGVMTIASSVLTTTDINGGTIDGTTIGGSSAAAGTFTTVGATTGNITTVNATTVDTTSIEVTNVKAKDGTASITIADSTGVATISAAPVLSALTASQAVFTDASKGLVSNAITGTGSVVMSASPTLSGTITAASLSMSGTLTLGSDVALSRGAADRLDLASGDSLNLVSGTYKIGNTDVLSSTTLGTNVVNSSLTSVGTLTSLTVSGDLTVDTNTLKVDSAGNRVLMGLSAAIQGDPLEIQTLAGGGTVSLFGRVSDNGSQIAFRANGATTQKAAIIGSDTGLQLITGTTVRATIDTSGNLGLGVTPSAWNSDYKAFNVGTSGFVYSRVGSQETAIGTNWLRNTSAAFVYAANGYASAYFQGNGIHTWSRAGNNTSGAGAALTFTDSMTLDASGNLGVGTTNITSGGGWLARVVAEGTSPALVVRGVNSQEVSIGASDGMFIDSLGSTTASNNTIRFRTSNTNSSFSATERARITSGGALCINGTSTLNANGILSVWNGSGAGAATGIATGYGTANGQFRLIYLNSAADALNFDNGNNNATLTSGGTWTNASDARIKKLIVDIKYGLATVMASQPRSFERVDVDGEYIGFVAQELLEVVPEVVYGTEEDKYSVDYGSLVAVAFKAIQEQQAIIEALEARLEALEA